MSLDPVLAWSPDPQRFLEDLEAKPSALERLADSVDAGADIARVPRTPAAVLFLGMGSSRFAAEDAARRLRALGCHAVSEYASTASLPPASRDLLVVAISASGMSRETVASVQRYRGTACTVALTEQHASPLAEACDITIPLMAGPEMGGVACRSFQHTGLILRRLEAHLADRSFDFGSLCGRAAEGTADLLDRRSEWLGPVAAGLDGPGVIGVLAPAERWSCAAQSALMFREGPRRQAVGSETGDWSHVDVYLTKSTDYRALLLTGSRYDHEAVEWLRQRGSTVVTLGPRRADVALAVDHLHSHHPEVAVHVDTLVAELVMARMWAAQAGGVTDR